MAAGVLASAMALLPGGGAGAQTPAPEQPPPPDLEIVPANPQPGRIVTVSGVCQFLTEDGQTVPGGTVIVALTDRTFDPPVDAFLEGNNLARVDVSTNQTDSTWSASFEVPEDIAPETNLFFVVECTGLNGFFQEGSFGVGLPGSPTTPAPGGGTGGSTGGSSSGGSTGSTAADPATPVEDEPSFTG